MNRSARTAKCSTLPIMNRAFQVLQLNGRKQDTVQHSLMNDSQLKDFSVLAISEPYAWRFDETVITAPMGHPNWTKITPTTQNRERWAFRSMLWIRRDIDAEQVPVESPDLTAVVLRLPDRSILVASIYIEPRDEESLLDMTNKLDRLIRNTRATISTRLDVILAGDFNRHDQLWGGDDVSPSRQGEADLIVYLMSEHAL
jgi:hypothetical protein